MKKFLVLIILLLLVSGAVLAQETTETPPVFCGTLADADCTLLESAQTAGMELSGATVDLAADLTISNIPDAQFDKLTFNLSGTGAYQVDPEIMGRYAALQHDPAALAENMDQLPQMLEELVNSFTGQINLTLSLPEALVNQMGSGSQEFPSSLSTELRIINGVGYINLDQLSESLGQAGVPSGWFGLEISRLLRSLLEQSAQQMSQGGTGMFPPGFDPSSLNAFTNPEALADFMSIERLADTDIGGESVAAFRTTFDYGAFFASDAFQDLMRQQSEASGQTLDDDQLAMMEQMFQDFELEVTQYIDQEAFFTRRVETNFHWDMSSVMSAANASSGGTATEQAAPVLDFNATLTYDNFNSPPTIEAPEDAQVFTAEDAIGMFFGGMMTPPDSSGSSSDAMESTPEATPGS